MKHYDDRIIEVHHWTEERAPRRNSGMPRILKKLIMLLFAAIIIWGFNTLSVLNEVKNGEVRVITRTATGEAWVYAEHPHVSVGDTITTYSGAMLRFEHDGVYVSQTILGVRVRSTIPFPIDSLIG